MTLTGSVAINGAVRNATVCLDLNANSICDAGEPAAAPTGVDGSFSLSYDSTKVTAAQAASASLIARIVPGPVNDATASIDAAATAPAALGTAFVLRQVPGKSGQINPLTTMVAQGMTQGMTEAQARANVAIQLGIAADRIDNYQADPALDDNKVVDTARQIAVDVVAVALANGVPLVVGDQAAALDGAPSDLSSLTYTNANNYLYRYFTRLPKAAGSTSVQTLEVRGGVTAGAPPTQESLYSFAYLGANGWARCNTLTIAGTRGTPARSFYCGALPQVGYAQPVSIAGRTMASVITEMQADPSSNTINNGVSTAGLLAELRNAVFPAGSNLVRRYNLTVQPAITISNTTTDARPQSEATTLEQLIASKPAAAAAANGVGSLSLGVTDLKNLRVAFTSSGGATGTVQYLDCDINAARTAVSNCKASSTGTYSIDTVGGRRVLRFTGQPGIVTAPSNGVFAEVQNELGFTGNWVFAAREGKTDRASTLSLQNRLDATAWAALRTWLAL